MTDPLSPVDDILAKAVAAILAGREREALDLFDAAAVLEIAIRSTSTTELGEPA
jgi:hypothetical protein